MALKRLPQAERLLSGALSGFLSDSATSATVNNPPDENKLPTYFEFEPGSDNAETVRVTAVSGNVITIERGVYNGGVGVEHQANSAYEQKMSQVHWDAVVAALESGYLTEDESQVFTRNSTSEFQIEDVDHTAMYQNGRIIRLNGTVDLVVLSSSYTGGHTVITVNDTTVPTPITSVEVAIQPRDMPGLAYLAIDTISEKTSAAGVTVDGVLLKDSQVSTDQINEKTGGAGVSVDGVLLKDSQVSTDQINEKTGGAGVTADGVLLKDGKVTGDVVRTPAPGSDTTASGVKVTLTAGENLVFGEVCYVKSDGKIWKADADAIATSSALLMALDSISADADGEFLITGFARNDAWSWTVGGLIFLSTTAGALTQTAPSGTDDVIQILGVATHADRMIFTPQLVQVEHT